MKFKDWLMREEDGGGGDAGGDGGTSTGDVASYPMIWAGYPGYNQPIRRWNSPLWDGVSKKRKKKKKRSKKKSK